MTADVLSSMADALVAKSGGLFSIFCSRCWAEARCHSSEPRDAFDSAVRRKAGEHFYQIGWRYHSNVLCPKCAKETSN